MTRLLLPIMLILLLVGLLSVVVIGKLGFSNGSELITQTHHDHEATSQRHDFALFEQPHRSLLSNSTTLALVDSNNDLDNQCDRKCGDHEVEYPFGFSAPPCALTRHFQLECRKGSMFLTNVNGSFTNNSLSEHSTEFQKKDHVIIDSFQVLNITPGYMIINTTTIKAGSCNYSSKWANLTDYGSGSIQLPRDGPFRTSRNNVFFASGCYAQGYSSSTSDPFDPSDDSYLASETGICGPTACDGNLHLDPYAYCNDYNCSSCTSSLPSSLEVYIWGGGICGFTGILYPSTFPRAQLQSDDLNNSTEAAQYGYGLQLQWILEVKEVEYPDCFSLKDEPTYACSRDASCTYINEKYVIGNMSLNYTGYFCECTREGYEGDGYKNGTGCKDINECEEPNLCYKEQGAKCKNLDGNFTCSCPGDLKGDGRRDGTGCKKSKTALIAGLSAGGVFLFLTLNSFVIWYIYRKRHKDLRRSASSSFFSADYSRREFLEEIQSKEGANICKLFTYEELQKSTNNFAVNMELGSGGFGTVFEGTLDDGTKLAIKKAKHDVGGHSDTKQFINEVTVLSQVNHRNLVKLLGCCLETAVPVLVYEYISNGNLFEHLRRDPILMPGGRTVVDGKDNKLHPSSILPPLSWNNRLKIAIGTAEALNYLHSGTSPPIYHRDVKTANILLDEHYNAKVADFGLSKFVPVEATHLSTAIQGTPGYMDPEYFDNCQITDKSDVYSFGVVLLELLTAEKPVDLSRQAGDQNLTLRCNRLIKYGRLEDIIDSCLEASSDPKMLAVIHGVANVAMKCVERLRDNRPSMREVLEELQSLTRRSARKDAYGLGRAIIDKSKSGKRVKVEELSGEPLLVFEGMSTNSENFYNSSVFASDGRNSNLTTSGSSGSGDVSRPTVELIPR